MRTPDRIEAVCADIVDHYHAKVAPLGLKAQVVAFDRELCVAYHDEIRSPLSAGEEATVVMTTAKDDPESGGLRPRATDEEQRVQDRFLDAATRSSS